MGCFYNSGMTTHDQSAPESREQIGVRLVLTRDALGITQKDMAAKMGISPSRLEGYESGRNLLKPDMAVLFMRAVPEAKLDFNWLYHGDLGGLAHGAAERIKLLQEDASRAA